MVIANEILELDMEIEIGRYHTYKRFPLLNLIKHYAMKAYGIVDVWIHNFLISALDGGEWSAQRPGHFNLWGKSPQYPLDRRLGGPQS
jgi:hypothetical protein